MNQDDEILKIVGESELQSRKEAALLIAESAKQAVASHRRTGETEAGISAGQFGRKVLVQTEWPGIAIDRPHKASKRLKESSSSARQKGRAGKVVAGLYYMERGFEAKVGEVLEILGRNLHNLRHKHHHHRSGFVCK